MKKSMILLCSFLLFLFACGEEEQTPIPPPADSDVEDLRSQYTVRTLTESFDGSGDATVDAAGFIYVANFGDRIDDANGKEVTKVDPATGELSVFATELVGPSGNAFDSKGNLFQANIKGNIISKISPDGQVDTFVSNGLRSPVGVVIDKEDNLYVCNCGGGSISKVTPDGNVSTFVQSGLLRCPNGIAIDENGNLYPVNFNNGNIFKVTPDGTITNFARIPGASCAHIDYGNNKLYVVGRGANQIFELNLQGEVSLIAGTGKSGDLDGGGDAAEFFIPNGIALSNDGSQIYVVDRLTGVGPPLNPVVVRVIEKK